MKSLRKLIPAVMCSILAATLMTGCNQQASEQAGDADSLMLDTINVPALIDSLRIEAASLAGKDTRHKIVNDTLTLCGVVTACSVDSAHSIALDLDLAGKEERSVMRLLMSLQHRISTQSSATLYSDAVSMLATLHPAASNKRSHAADTEAAIMLQLVDDHLLINLYPACDQSELEFLMECINDPSLWIDAEEEIEEEQEEGEELS